MAGAIPEEVKQTIAAVQAREGWQAPGAWAVGLARFDGMPNEDGMVAADAAVLDVWFPTVNCNQNNGAAAVVAEAVGHTAGSASYQLDAASIEKIQTAFAPLWAERHSHPNLRALSVVAEAARTQNPRPLAPHAVVVTFIEDLASAPVSAEDVYLRLQLLSHRAIQPHGASLDGAFGLLTNVAWTSHGPFAATFVECARGMLRQQGQQLSVTSVDKFPRMTDYVVPEGVRIADADRVRLGAHLAPGTTIMHEGFVNFNAGTLGASMVEGRISAGVVVGDGSDVGGGASIMGTLSGGGQEVIRIGEGCLLGANAGLGISLGDRCTIEAGTYVTAGAKVTYHGTVVKAGSLSGKSDLLFRRHSQTGALEAIERANTVALNEALHAN